MDLRLGHPEHTCIRRGGEEGGGVKERKGVEGLVGNRGPGAGTTFAGPTTSMLAILPMVPEFAASAAAAGAGPVLADAAALLRFRVQSDILSTV